MVVGAATTQAVGNEQLTKTRVSSVCLALNWSLVNGNCRQCQDEKTIHAITLEKEKITYWPFKGGTADGM